MYVDLRPKLKVGDIVNIRYYNKDGTAAKATIIAIYRQWKPNSKCIIGHVEGKETIISWCAAGTESINGQKKRDIILETKRLFTAQEMFQKFPRLKFLLNGDINLEPNAKTKLFISGNLLPYLGWNIEDIKNKGIKAKILDIFTQSDNTENNVVSLTR